MSSTTNILLRLLSVVFKLVGLGCIVLAFSLAQTVIGARGRSLYDSVPEMYSLQLALAILVPAAAGVITFGVSFLLDIWISIRGLKLHVMQSASREK